MIREAVAKIRVGFIDCSDRAVQRMCAGYTGNDGYSSGSDIQTRWVELKCKGCVDHSGFDTSAESAGTVDCINRMSPTAAILAAAAKWSAGMTHLG